MLRLIKLTALAILPLAVASQTSAAQVFGSSSAAGISAQPPSSNSGFRPSVFGPAIFTKSYSVAVNANGTMSLGPAGAVSDNFNNGNAGSFEVIFPTNVSTCVYTATLGDAFGGVAGPGYVTVDQRAGNPNGVFISTYATNGVRAYRNFMLHVQC